MIPVWLSAIKELIDSTRYLAFPFYYHAEVNDSEENPQILISRKSFFLLYTLFNAKKCMFFNESL